METSERFDERLEETESEIENLGDQETREEYEDRLDQVEELQQQERLEEARSELSQLEEEIMQEGESLSQPLEERINSFEERGVEVQQVNIREEQEDGNKSQEDGNSGGVLGGFGELIKNTFQPGQWGEEGSFLRNIGNAVASFLTTSEGDQSAEEIRRQERISSFLAERDFADSQRAIESTLGLVQDISYENIMDVVNNETKSIEDKKESLKELVSNNTEDDKQVSFNPDQERFIERYIRLLELNQEYISENIENDTGSKTIRDINSLLFEVTSNTTRAEEGVYMLNWTDFSSGDRVTQTDSETDDTPEEYADETQEEQEVQQTPEDSQDDSEEDPAEDDETDDQPSQEEIRIVDYESLQDLDVSDIENLSNDQLKDIRYYSIKNSIENSDGFPINITYFQESDKQEMYQQKAIENGIDIPESVDFDLDNYQLVIGNNSYEFFYEYQDESWYKVEGGEFDMDVTNNSGNISITAEGTVDHLLGDTTATVTNTINSSNFLQMINDIIENDGTQLTLFDETTDIVVDGFGDEDDVRSRIGSELYIRNRSEGFGSEPSSSDFV